MLSKKDYIKIWSREYTVQYCEIAMRCVSKYTSPRVMPPKMDIFFIPEQKNSSVFVEIRQLKASDEALEQIILHPKKQKLFINQFHKFGRNYVALSKFIGKKNLSGINTAKLIKLYNSYIKIWTQYSHFLWAIYDLNELVAHKGKLILENKNLNPKIHEMATHALFAPSKKTGILKLQEELENLKLRGHKTLPPLQTKKIIKNYCWMPCLDLQNEPWTEADVNSFYENLIPKKSSSPIKYSPKLINLTAGEKRFFRFVREIAYLKDLRDVYRRQGIYHILPLYNEIGARLKIPRRDVASLTTNETRSVLKNKRTINIKNLIKGRKRGYGMVWAKNNIIVLTKPREISKLTRLTKANAASKKIISGIVACKGKVRGTVKIIYRAEDTRKIHKGDVLVAITTHPDYVPAMQRSIAIITDEGGLTSHAAIVARELNIPCIVGVKTATQMLKDGDLVEVDANTGIVKKL